MVKTMVQVEKENVEANIPSTHVIVHQTKRGTLEGKANKFDHLIKSFP